MDFYKRKLKSAIEKDRMDLEWMIKKNDFYPKAAEASENARKRGNELYMRQRHNSSIHRQIFKHYCDSVMYAPVKSEPLALALGNRSAFLLHIQKYKECIQDINRAVEITQSNELKVKLLCRKIECLKRLGSSEYQRDLNEIDICIDKISDNKTKRQFAKKLKSIETLAISEKEPSLNENDPKFIDFGLKKNDILKQIEIRHSDRYGRHIVAAKDYKPSDIIFKEDLFTTTIQPTRASISCHYCCKTAWAGIPCDECIWVMFCSEECKEKAWKEFHDIECSVISYMRLNTETITWDTSLRLLVLGLKECGSVENLRKELQSVDTCTDVVRKGFYEDGKLSTNTIRSMYSLKADGLPGHHEGNIILSIPSILVGLAKCRNMPKKYTVKKIKDILNNDDLMFLGALLIKFTVICTFNAFGYQPQHKCEISSRTSKDLGNCEGNCKDDSCCERAIAVSPFASLFNHSCFPNASRIFTDDRKIAIYAVHPIKKDSQIFISYYCAFHSFPFYERQEILYDHYAFKCDCEPCVEGWPMILDEEYNEIVIKSPEEAIFKSCEIIISRVHDNTESLVYDKKIVKKLSTAILKAFERLEQPSHLTCLLIKSLMLYYQRTLGLQPESFGDCDKFSKSNVVSK